MTPQFEEWFERNIPVKCYTPEELEDLKTNMWLAWRDSRRLIGEGETLRKGQMVKCVAIHNGSGDYLTAGKLYPVLAVGGDNDTVCGGVVDRGDFLTVGDNGEKLYCCYDTGCLHAEWELVQE
ncbi:MAG: hypothetical protein ACRCYD_00755 [Plesiomonas sp.]